MCHQRGFGSRSHDLSADEMLEPTRTSTRGLDVGDATFALPGGMSICDGLAVALDKFFTKKFLMNFFQTWKLSALAAGPRKAVMSIQ